MTNSGETSAGVRKVAIVAASVEAILRLRSDLVRRIADQHRVLCLAPAADAQAVKALIALGVEYRALDFAPPGWKAFRSYRVLKALREIYKDWRPDVVIGIGPEPLVYNALSAKRQRVARIVSVMTELPACLLETQTAKEFPSKGAFRLALARSHRVVVHNRDHGPFLKQQGLLGARQNADVVCGVGVDLQENGLEPLPAFEGGITFLMVARRDAIKGIPDYVAAARRVAAHAKGAKFVLAGPPGDDDINPVTLGFAGPSFRFDPGLADIKAELKSAHVFVYPSHSEGMPPAVLEALAAGRPVITTDTPGCRETVDEKVNGCVVPRGNILALAEAMESFLRRPDLISSMSRASRLKAERRFDRSAVNAQMIKILGL